MSEPSSSGERDRLLAALRTRLQRFSTTEDAQVVLDHDALGEVTALISIAPPNDLEAAQAAGLLHWFRYLVLPAGEDQEDLQQAFLHFAPVYTAYPDAVPEPLQQLLRQAGFVPETGTPATEAGQWTDQAGDFLYRYQRTGQPADLEEAIGLFRKAVMSSQENDPDHAAYLNNLGSALRDRFQHTAEEPDLEEAIVVFRRAVEASREDDCSDHAAYLSNLGGALRVRFGRIGKVSDLVEALGFLRKALAVSPENDPHHAAHLSNLANALRDHVKLTRHVPDLDEAISLLRQAAAAPAELPSRLRRLSKLGDALLERFEHVGQLSDLEEAIGLLRQAAASPANLRDDVIDPTGLGGALWARFKRIGQLSDLEEAISLFRQALATSTDDQTSRADRLSNLSGALLDRFERTQYMPNLEEAIATARQALAGSRADQPGHADHLSSLGNTLQVRARSEGTEGSTDLDEAIGLYQMAVAATPDDHRERMARLNNLGIALHTRFQRTGRSADLDGAISLLQKATPAAPGAEPRTPGRLSNLGFALLDRFRRSSQASDLYQAMQAFRDAAAMESQSALWRVRIARSWGSTAAQAGDWRQAAQGFSLAVSLLPQVASRHLQRGDQEYSLSQLVDLASDAAACALHAGDADQAVQLLEQGRGIILTQALEAHGDLTDLQERAPELAARFTQLRDQLDAPDLDRASVLFSNEQGIRAVVLGDAIESRTTIADLRGLLQALQSGRYPADVLEPTTESAGRFAELRDPGGPLDSRHVPDTAAGQLVEPSSMRLEAGGAERRRELASAWDDLVTQIRALPGFANFMHPPTLAELLRCSTSGPLVMINISDYRSDALILTPRGVETVSLPDLQPMSVLYHTVLFFGALNAAHDPEQSLQDQREAEAIIGSVLGWLWDAAVGPVLDRLGISIVPGPGQAWPRVWWSPSGLLGYLPLHAAGHHDERDQEHARTVFDRVVSSYIPTVRALQYARRGPQKRRAHPQMLIVAMPRTKGAPDLPGARREADLLSAMFPGDKLTGPQATRAQVCPRLPTHAYAHFACHGLSDWSNPSNSQLLLHDHQRNALTVLDVSRLHLTDARLAYLSACKTTRTNPYLIDESIHITGAFQLAGYTHVVGTLWSIDDTVAVRIAHAVYKDLQPAQGTAPLYAGRTSVALHSATRALRNAYPNTPSLWAAHIHVGP
jgi:tetratricopeptide (TPR) repeat protein